MRIASLDSCWVLSAAVVPVVVVDWGPCGSVQRVRVSTRFSDEKVRDFLAREIFDSDFVVDDASACRHTSWIDPLRRAVASSSGGQMPISRLSVRSSFVGDPLARAGRPTSCPGRLVVRDVFQGVPSGPSAASSWTCPGWDTVGSGVL